MERILSTLANVFFKKRELGQNDSRNLCHLIKILQIQNRKMVLCKRHDHPQNPPSSPPSLMVAVLRWEPIGIRKIHQNTRCISMYFAYSNGLPSQYCHHYLSPNPLNKRLHTLNTSARRRALTSLCSHHHCWSLGQSGEVPSGWCRSICSRAYCALRGSM